MKSKQYPSQNEIKELFEYRDGRLHWKKKIARCEIGNKAGTKHKQSGYRRIAIKGNQYLEHRLIWMMFNGDIPDGMQIDHINRIKDDNRIENLRIVHHQINGLNKNSKNVSLRNNKFMGKVVLNGNLIHKRFDNYEEAKNWVIEKKSEIFEELGLTFHMD